MTLYLVPPRRVTEAEAAILDVSDEKRRLLASTGLSKVFGMLFPVMLLLAVAPGARAQADQILLKDFRPVSLHKSHVTEVERARYPVIDMHSHPYARSLAEVEQWVRNMDEVGIERTVILTKAVGAQFDSLLAVYSAHDGRFDVWCGFDLSGYDEPGFGPDAVAELERCAAVGGKGVGEISDKGSGLDSGGVLAKGMHLDDPRMDPLLEKCGELGLPVNIHVADPIWMYQAMDSTNDGLMTAYRWRLDDKPDIVDHQGMMQILERAVQRHPNTTFIAVHFANLSYDLEQLGNMLDRNPNLYADISARYAETAQIPRFVANFYERYQNRLLYGTDLGYSPRMYRTTFRVLETEDEHFYEHDIFSQHWSLNGFGLDDAILRKIYRENALAIISGNVNN